MTPEEKQTLEILTEATKDLKKKQLVHVQAGDVATICRLAAKSVPATPSKPEGSK